MANKTVVFITAFANVSHFEKFLMIRANCNRDKRLNGQLSNRLVNWQREKNSGRQTIYYRLLQIYLFIGWNCNGIRFFVIDLATVWKTPHKHLFICHTACPFHRIHLFVFVSNFVHKFLSPFPLNLFVKKRLIWNRSLIHIGNDDDGHKIAIPLLGILQCSCMFIGVKSENFVM